MLGIAFAMGQGGAEGAGGITSFIPLILMFVIFYFLLIRPQQKKTKDHREMITNLRKGDRVITTGGIYGRITGLDEHRVTLEISDKVRIKLVRGNIAGLDQPSPATRPAKSAKANSGKSTKK